MTCVDVYRIEHRDALGKLLAAWEGSEVRKAHERLRELMCGLFLGDFVIITMKLEETGDGHLHA